MARHSPPVRVGVKRTLSRHRSQVSCARAANLCCTFARTTTEPRSDGGGSHLACSQDAGRGCRRRHPESARDAQTSDGQLRAKPYDGTVKGPGSRNRRDCRDGNGTRPPVPEQPESLAGSNAHESSWTRNREVTLPSLPPDRAAMMEVSSARILAVSDLTASEAKSLSYEPPTGVETSQTFAAELARVAWTKDARHDNVYTRPCFGQESSASFNQNVADGHTELSLALPFGINVDPEDLVRRASYAWRTIRRMHPECAIELTTGLERPQMMRYSMVAPGGHEEQEWLSETFIPIQGTRDRTWKDVVEMTYNRKLPTRGKRAMMYLVLAPQDSSSSRERPSEEEEELRQHCLIYNVAHAVTDGFSFVVFLNAYMQLLADAGGAAPPDSSSTLPPQDVLFRLPDSVLPAYVRRYHPSVSDREESLRHALEQMQLYAAKMPLSVALTPRADYTQRRHKTGCIVSRLAQDVSESVLKSLRSHQSRLSITYLGAAATILSILSLYGRGHEQGALLGMTRNARRWVETEATHSGTAAIPMATDVVYLWIDFAELDTSMTPESARVPSAELLIALGQRIKTALAPHLLSPHYMASISAMAEGFIDTLDTASRVPPGCESVGTQAPGFSPGGAWPVGKHFSSKDGRVALQRAWLYQYGRQVNPSPWISMCSIDGRLCLHCGYDERYYEADTMQEMVRRTRASIERLSAAS